MDVVEFETLAGNSQFLGLAEKIGLKGMGVEKGEGKDKEWIWELKKVDWESAKGA